MSRIALQRIALFVIGLVVIGGLFAWLQAAPDSRSVRNFPSEGVDIIAFGDSLVWGQGADPGKDFVSLLSERLQAPIINLGVPGNTTDDGLSRIEEIDAYRPKVVLLLLGGNDYLRRIPQERTQLNLAKLITEIQARGAIVVLLGVRGGILEDHYAPMYEGLSEQYRTAYVSNVLKGLLGDQKYMFDEIHPNNSGYAIIADRVFPVLAPLLK